MGIKKYILKKIINWIEKVLKVFVKEFPRSLISLSIIPVIIYVMAGAISDVSLFATMGYIIVCIIKLDKLLEDIRRTLLWGVGYVVGAIAFGLIFTSVIPLFSKGEATSIFAAMVIFGVIISIYLKSNEMKNG